jgi:glycosyltransferase involved in cell wall biosynthesis
VALLRQRIAHYGLKDSVSILGSVSDEILKEEYDKADIVTNLRYPAFEGGSASLCEQLMSGKVTIVCDTGVYSEVPDECVIKVNPMSIDISLANVYHDILSGKIELGSIRAKAREYALEHHTDSNYRQKVVSFLEQVCFEGPMRELLTALDEDVTCLSNSDLNQRLCNQIELLFGK